MFNWKKVFSTETEKVTVEEEVQDEFPRFFSTRVVREPNSSLLFLPGLCLVALALVTVFAPRLLLWAIGGILFLFGVGLFVLAWKLIRFKQRVEEMAKRFQGRVYIQGMDIQDSSEFTNEEDDEDIIVYH